MLPFLVVDISGSSNHCEDNNNQNNERKVCEIVRNSENRMEQKRMWERRFHQIHSQIHFHNAEILLRTWRFH